MRRLLVVALTGALAGTAVAQQQGMEPGEWELTTTISSPMMPQAQSATVKHCIKAISQLALLPSRSSGVSLQSLPGGVPPIQREGSARSSALMQCFTVAVCGCGIMGDEIVVVSSHSPGSMPRSCAAAPLLKPASRARTSNRFFMQALLQSVSR